MKKMKFAAMFAAFVSVFGLTSCLNDDSDGSSNQLQSLMTIESWMGYTTMYADEFPGQALLPTNQALTAVGIPASATRALVVYTIPEGQDLTADKVKITVTEGREWPVRRISALPDTCATYTDPITSFSDYAISWGVSFKSGFIARNRYLNVGYQYKPYSKIAKTALVPNRVSNDTLYLDFKMKKTEEMYGSPQVFMDTYDLMSCPIEYASGLAQYDSVYVTISSMVSPYSGTAYKDSVTSRCKASAFGDSMMPH